VILAMTPLIGSAVRRWTPRADDLLRPALIHFALTVPFALIHIGAVWVLRQLAYALAQTHYDFFENGVALRLLYEWRKDVLVYAVIALVYWLFDRFAAQTGAPENADTRIEVRDGASTLYLAPAEVLMVEAAGNYVEFHTAGRTHLVRGTLAAWEAKLGARGFVRVHRARLINRAHVAATRPTPAGDVDITLDDGRIVGGSRRYREALSAATA
jgi:DNA-binding LytR/AlgR family response regulator